MEHKENSLTALKVLYVEDEQEARESLYKYLKRRVGKIYAAADGSEGLYLYKEHSPHIIIADLYMPNMGGIEMIKEIRNTDQDCYVIVLSAVKDLEVILKSVDAGIHKYLMKPIDPDELLNALYEAAEKISRKKNDSSSIDTEHKKRMEDEIKKEFSAFLKATTGKGPRDVMVFIHENLIDITAYDVLTLMEKNMIDNRKNQVIIEQNRKLFYSIQEEQMCRIVEDILHRKVKLKQVEVNAEKNISQMTLHIL